MQTPRYALVAYVRDPAGEFVERLRQELHPDHTHLPAHLTILPPRCLLGDELAALELLEEVCSHADPFEITLGEVESHVFWRVSSCRRPRCNIRSDMQSTHRAAITLRVEIKLQA